MTPSSSAEVRPQTLVCGRWRLVMSGVPRSTMRGQPSTFLIIHRLVRIIPPQHAADLLHEQYTLHITHTGEDNRRSYLYLYAGLVARLGQRLVCCLAVNASTLPLEKAVGYVVLYESLLAYHRCPWYRSLVLRYRNFHWERLIPVDRQRTGKPLKFSTKKAFRL